MSGEIYRPSAIANYFLKRGFEENLAITPLKLIKLVYIAHGWSLAVFNQELFNSPVQAWKHGPVIESLYHEFKHFGKKAITELAVEFDFQGNYALSRAVVNEPMVRESDDQTMAILDKVWDTYRSFDGWELRNLTHEFGTPWDATYNVKPKGDVIANDLIAKHFREKIKLYINSAKQIQEVA